MPSDSPDLPALRRFRDRAAGRFDDSAALWNEVAARMFSRLDLVRVPPGPILDLGCASGAWTSRLSQRYAGADVFGHDLSEALLRQAQARADADRSWLSRLSKRPSRFACVEFDRLPWRPGSFALIWSNLVAPWFRDPPTAWRRIGVSLRPGGLLAFSTLGPDTLREFQRAWAATGRAPATLPFADMHDIGDALVRAGFADPVMDVDVIQLTYRSIDAMVRDARDQGAQNVLASRPRGLLSPRRWQRAQSQFISDSQNGLFTVTFEVVFGHAWWPEQGPRKTADGRDVVRFHRR